MEQRGPDFSATEKLVVFDFDDTLYAHTYHGVANSCGLPPTSQVDLWRLSDKPFLERAVRTLIESGVHVGVASFGNKAVIINTMNTVLYGKAMPPVGERYFNASNVMTAEDVPVEWADALGRISSTFKEYLKRHSDPKEAFAAFKREKRPEREAKYYCLKLDPAAKVEMIRKLCEKYDVDSLSVVRFFDDDAGNVHAALSAGVMAHHVPGKTGLTERWWRDQCRDIANGCLAYAAVWSPPTPPSTKRTRSASASPLTPRSPRGSSSPIVRASP